MTLTIHISKDVNIAPEDLYALAAQPKALKVTGIFITLASIASFFGIPVVISGLFFKDFFEDTIWKNRPAKPSVVTRSQVINVITKALKSLMFPLFVTLLYFFGTVAMLFVNPELIISLLYLRAIIRFSLFSNNDLIRILFYQISLYLLCGGFFKFLFPDVKPFNVLV